MTKQTHQTISYRPKVLTPTTLHWLGSASSTSHVIEHIPFKAITGKDLGY